MSFKAVATLLIVIALFCGSMCKLYTSFGEFKSLQFEDDILYSTNRSIVMGWIIKFDNLVRIRLDFLKAE